MTEPKMVMFCRIYARMVTIWLDIHLVFVLSMEYGVQKHQNANLLRVKQFYICLIKFFYIYNLK